MYKCICVFWNDIVLYDLYVFFFLDLKEGEKVIRKKKNLKESDNEKI